MFGCSKEQDAAPVPEHPGKSIYLKSCFSCHASGSAGAPRTGDVEAWGPRAEKGAEALLAATIEGIPPAMPAKGLCIDCTNEQLAQAIDYMIQESQPEPEAPAE